MKAAHLILLISILSFLLNCKLSAQFSDALKIDYFGQTPQGKSAVVFAPDFICTPGKFVQNCCFSPDGKKFAFVLQNKEWNHPAVMYTQYINGRWSEPDTLFDYASTPYFSHDGKLLYCTKKDSSTRDIWVSKRVGKGWDEPVKVPFPVSSEDGNEFEVSDAADGTLYFSSSRPGGYGDLDVYRAELVDGNFTNVTNLGVPINTGSKDECPYIAPDESFMVFNDWKYNEKFAGNNIYISYKKEDLTWTNPKDLGSVVNTNDLDIYPYITPDGKYLIFTRRSNRYPATFSKLYWVSTEILDSVKDADLSEGIQTIKPDPPKYPFV